jgi:hypothetical protein
MNRSTLHQNCIITQDARKAKMNKGLSLTKLLHNLIREHGTYKHGSYAVDVDTLPISDKRLLISHFESAEWYEYACKSHLHTETLFAEHKKYIQELMDENAHEVYQDAMEEMRAYR